MSFSNPSGRCVGFFKINPTNFDRHGLLYDLTHTISDLSLDIASAHIATFGERVVDTFYVTDLGKAFRVDLSSKAEEVAMPEKDCVVSLSSQAGVRVGQVNGVKVYYVHLKNIYWPFGHPEVPVIAKPLWHAIDAYNPFMASVIGDILDAEAIDVVHTHNLTGFSVSAWRQVKQRGLPLVHTLRDYSLLCPENDHVL